MKSKEVKKDLFKRGRSRTPNCSRGGGIYFLGFVGAAIYYIQNSSGFWNIVLAMLKAIVWPVLLVYHLLGI